MNLSYWLWLLWIKTIANPVSHKLWCHELLLSCSRDGDYCCIWFNGNPRQFHCEIRKIQNKQCKNESCFVMEVYICPSVAVKVCKLTFWSDIWTFYCVKFKIKYKYIHKYFCIDIPVNATCVCQMSYFNVNDHVVDI